MMAPMEPGTEDAAHLFAIACERVNDFSRRLETDGEFISVRVGADIRKYESGWRLEKWVEAEIDREEMLWAAWWLDLNRKDYNWIVNAHVSISHGEFFAEFPVRSAASLNDLEEHLHATVEELITAKETRFDFAYKIKKLSQKSKCSEPQ
jgi:hypothetical protein